MIKEFKCNWRIRFKMKNSEKFIKNYNIQTNLMKIEDLMKISEKNEKIMHMTEFGGS